MILQLIYFFIISAFCLAWGFPAVCIAKKKERSLNAQDILLSFFVGLVLISVFASWISLFTAVRFKILFIITIPIFLLNLKYIKRLPSIKPPYFKGKHAKIELFFAVVVCLLFLFLSTGKPTMEDTELYHIQNIQWIHQFGTVPGLANLYLRFGFYSNWFHAVSLFDIANLNKNFLYLNFTFVVWLFLFLFYQYREFGSSNEPVKKHLSLFFLATLFFMLIEWDLFRVASSSTSYDFVVTGSALICLSLLLKKVMGYDDTNDFNILLLIIAAPFYKLTGTFLLPFWLLLFFVSKNKSKLLLYSTITLFVCIIPYGVKNVVQTGYIFYPYMALTPFEPDWQVPPSMVVLFNKYIDLSNHYINQSVPGFPHNDGTSFSFMRDWFLHLVKADQLFLASSVIALPLAWKYLKATYQSRLARVLFLYTLCIPGIIVWLIASPDPRFAFGLLIFVCLFPISAIASVYVPKRLITGSMLLFSLATLFYISAKGRKQFSIMNILQPTSVDVPKYTRVTINNRVYHIPEIINNNWNSRCIDVPLPCIYEHNPFLQPRGDKMSDGFKMDPHPDSSFILKYRY